MCPRPSLGWRMHENDEWRPPEEARKLAMPRERPQTPRLIEQASEWMEAGASRGFLRKFLATEGPGVASPQDGSTFEVQSFVLTKPAMAARSQDAPVRPKTPVLP